MDSAKPSLSVSGSPILTWLIFSRFFMDIHRVRIWCLNQTYLPIPSAKSQQRLFGLTSPKASLANPFYGKKVIQVVFDVISNTKTLFYAFTNDCICLFFSLSSRSPFFFSSSFRLGLIVFFTVLFFMGLFHSRFMLIAKHHLPPSPVQPIRGQSGSSVIHQSALQKRKKKKWPLFTTPKNNFWISSFPFPLFLPPVSLSLSFFSLLQKPLALYIT